MLLQYSECFVAIMGNHCALGQKNAWVILITTARPVLSSFDADF